MNSAFESLFENAFQLTLTVIKDDPMHNIFGQSEISKLAECLALNENAIIKIKNFLYKLFINVFKGSNICMSQDREMLFSKLHQIRIKMAVEKQFTDLFSGLGFSDHVCNNFMQDFLLELTDQLLQEQIKQEKKTINKKVNLN